MPPYPLDSAFRIRGPALRRRARRGSRDRARRRRRRPRGPGLRRRRGRAVLHVASRARPHGRDQAARARDRPRSRRRPRRRQRGQRDDARPRRPPASSASRARSDRRRASRRVDRATGAAETVVDALRGLPLNSPNDVVVDARRHDLVHRPELRLPAGLPARARARRPRLPPRPGDRADDGRRRRLRQAERPRVLARRARPLRRRHRRNRARQLRLAALRRLLDGPAARPGAACSPSRRPGYPDGIKVDADGRVYASVVERRAGLRRPTASCSARSACPAPSTSPSAGPTATSSSSPPTPPSGPPSSSAKGA